MNKNLTAFDQFVSEMTGDLAKTTIGMGRIFDGLRTVIGTYDSYPPFNFEQISETKYRMVFALAGFTKDDIDVEVKGNFVTIVGEKKDKKNKDEPIYLHRGIATRSFKRLVQIADDVVVNDASMNDGLLSINLEQIIPTEMQAKTIKIK